MLNQQQRGVQGKWETQVDLWFGVLLVGFGVAQTLGQAGEVAVVGWVALEVVFVFVVGGAQVAGVWLVALP